MHMFRREADFGAFDRVMIETHQRQPHRILSYCVLSDHWHFVVWPEEDGQLTAFFRRLAHTHAMRWRVSHRTVVYGHLYQGRFKSFPVQDDDHLHSLLRYVERNPLSAGLVDRAQLWPWGSLWSRTHGNQAIKALLSPWPIERPANWTARVNTPLTARELDRVWVSIERGRPYGGHDWVRQMVKDLGLEHTVRSEGRPRKASQSVTDPTG
jgi:putative transposase